MRAGIHLLVMANAALFVSGCAREEPETTAEQATVPTAEPTALAVEMWLDDFAIASADQTTDPSAQNADDFVPGEPIELSMSVQDAPENVAVTTYWYGPQEQPLSYETKRVSPDAERLTFTHDNTHDWSPGTYRAEVWVGDEKVNEQQFQIISG